MYANSANTDSFVQSIVYSQSKKDENSGLHFIQGIVENINEDGNCCDVKIDSQRDPITDVEVLCEKFPKKQQEVTVMIQGTNDPKIIWIHDDWFRTKKNLTQTFCNKECNCTFAGYVAPTF